MSDTINLELPYLAASQAQKHVTHNAALSRLDALVQLAVLSRGLASPPPSPTEGERYLIAALPTGAWAGQAGKLTFFSDGFWQFVTPREGFSIWINNENVAQWFDGVNWVDGAVPTSLQNLNLLGVNATADSTAKFAVASPTTLFNHAGAGHQLKINKAALGNSAAILLQNNFSSRAEIGLSGDDDVHLKVSSDGTAFTEALTLASATGKVTAHQGFKLAPQSNDPAALEDGLVWYSQTSGRFRKRQAGITTDLDTSGGGGGLADGDYGDVVVSNGAAILSVEGASGAFALSGIVTPPIISANVNDYAPSGMANASVLRLSTDSHARTITGLTGGVAGRLVELWNVGAFDVVLENEEPNSSVANRFNFGGQDYFIEPGGSFILQYDAVQTRWIAAANPNASQLTAISRRRSLFSTDFITASVNSNPPFVGAAISSGTTASVAAGLDSNHYGIVRLSSATTANSGFRWMSDVLAIKISGSEFFEVIFRPQNFATTMNRIGFFDTASSADAVDGVYFETTTSGLIVCKTASNSVRTTSATIATLALNTWYRATISINRNASIVTYRIFDGNGVIIGSQTITTNIPTVAGREVGVGIIATNSGTVATAMMDVDYMAVGFGALRPLAR